MATFNELMSFSAKASADLTGARHTIQRFTAAGETNIASHAAATLVNGPIGVLQNKPNSGQHATIAFAGETKVVAGGSITANNVVTTNGSGRATAATSGDIAIGRAMEAASQDGDVIRMLLMDPQPLLRT